MSQQTMLDPFALWKSMYEQAESNFNEVINEVIKKESFAEWLGQVQGNYLQYQELIQNTTDTYLKQINVPTKDEVSNIAALVINVEDKVEKLDEKVEDELLNNSLVAEMNKLKSSISKLDRKMDQILKLMKQMDSASESSPSSSK